MEYLRNTAYKIWIGDLIKGEYIKSDEDFKPNFISAKNLIISRVNLIGVVIDKYTNLDKTYSFIMIDDGSAVIRARVWNEDIKLFENLDVGNSVLILGKVKEQNGEIYIMPEFANKLSNSSWAKLRREELLKLYGEPGKIEAEQKNDTMISDPPIDVGRKAIINLIEKLDKGDGAESAKIIKEFGASEEKANALIYELIKEGEVFEYKQGRLKLAG